MQDEDDILENVAQKFHRIFTRNDHFKVGCALCILLCDNLLTRTQVRPRPIPDIKFAVEMLLLSAVVLEVAFPVYSSVNRWLHVSSIDMLL